MEVTGAVALLEQLGYAGVAAEGCGEKSLERLDKYLDLSEKKGDDFVIPAVYMPHRFHQFGFDDSAQRAAIDRLAGKDGATLWAWVHDSKPDGAITDEKDRRGRTVVILGRFSGQKPPLVKSHIAIFRV